MRINLEYKENSHLDYTKYKNFINEHDKEWFIYHIKYYQTLLCKINIYIKFYKYLFANLNKSKTLLSGILLESFCESITYIIYKLFGKSNKNNISKFKNKIYVLYKNKAIEFKSTLKFTKEDDETINLVLEARKKVYGHSDDESFSVENIDNLMSKINIDDVVNITKKCMIFLNDLWKSFCDHELSFDLKNDKILMDTFCKVTEQL